MATMMILLALPSYAQYEDDYANHGGDYYADSYGPEKGDHERPYLAYSFTPKYKVDDAVEHAGHRGYGHSYGPPYGSYAYSHGYPHHKRRYPRWRKTCVFGPLREKKVCDYEPPRCWKERECYIVYGKKYCRHFTKCAGGERRCYWVKKPHYGGHSCGVPY